MMVPRKVVILGGGLAGLAAAVPLADEGFQVTLLERRPFLGGRASSFPVSALCRPLDGMPAETGESPGAKDKPELGSSSTAGRELLSRGQESLDNCQHVLLKCCTNLLDFYRRLGVQQGIAFYDRFMFLDEEGRMAVLKGSRWIAPFHLLPSFFRFTPLPWKDKLAIAYAFICMLREEGRLEELDRVTMLDWLRHHWQPSHAIETFWRVLLVSALNEDIEVASARYGLKFFLDGLLKHRQAFHMGVPIRPLSQLYTEPCSKFLNERNGTVRLRADVLRIDVEGSRVAQMCLNDGTDVRGDYYVSSVPPHVLFKLLPGSARQGYPCFASLNRFESSPITAIYLWFDSQITDLKYATLLGREIQWIFNKGTNVNSASAQSDDYLGLVVSASRSLLPLGRSQIVEIALRDLYQVLPATRDAKLLRSVVIKEPFATFSCRAGCDEIRPDQKSPLDNFFVAGDWTQTGLPATMESAVRSGYRCAELILHGEGIVRSLVQPDLPAQGLARWLSRLLGHQRNRAQKEIPF